MTSKWTSDDIPSQQGRITIVTGANSGLGFQTALELARHGATVVMAARNAERGEQARRRLTDTCPEADATVLPLDLADLRSVRAFADAVQGRHPRIDLLINNAGIMGVPFARTADGFESHLGVNHLGHFALTGLLLPALLAAPSARVVSVSSEMRRVGRIHLDDLMWVRRYRAWPAYAQSKLANLLFAFELHRRAVARNWPLTSVAAHPGYAATRLLYGDTESGRRSRLATVATVGYLFAQTAAQGAWPILYAATMPDVEGGDYYGPISLGGMRGHPRPVPLSLTNRDRVIAERLWERSVELTGVHFEPGRTQL